MNGENIASVTLKGGQILFGFEDDKWVFGEIKKHRDFYESTLLEKWYVPYDLRTVFDIGGNIGNHTVCFATTKPQAQVYTFEPIPDNYRMLETNVRANRLGGRVRLFNKGASDKKGCAYMKMVDDKDHGSWSIVPQEEGTHEIEVAAIDDMDLPLPDFVKIDAEGHESQILKGMAKTLAQSNALVWIEVLYGNQVEVLRIMQGMGYEIADYVMGTYPGFNILFAKPGKDINPTEILVNLLFEHNLNNMLLQSKERGSLQ